jgi:glutamate dehydrogenase
MAVKSAELDAERIDSVCERVRERLPIEVAGACESFVRQYYHWVPAEDLAERNSLDLYGAAVAHWNLAQQRPKGTAKVHVYNPEFDQHGWSSQHTVVEVVSDDMPFIVDSVTMELARRGYSIDLVIHPVIRVRRDEHGELTEVLEPGIPAKDAIAESVLHAEVIREPDPEELRNLHRHIERVLNEVRATVEDWKPMRAKAEKLIEELEADPPPVERRELDEVKAFLDWITHDNFTFLGYREYRFEQQDGDTGLSVIPGTGLGILRRDPDTTFKKLRPKAVALAKERHLLVLTKANSRSTVHRPSYLDYIGVREFDLDGHVVGERRFLGLFTTAAYKASPREIPLLRAKFTNVLERSGFPPDSHDAKALVDFLESYPRDALFQTGTDELFDIAMRMLGLGERQRVRLFLRHDQLDRFIACLVTIPRDRFNTENREKVGRILLETFNGTHLDWSLQLSESVLARVYYIVHCPDGVPTDYDLFEIERRLVEATRAWADDLRAALITEHGEQNGLKQFKRYERAFPPGYRSDWLARSAVGDIARLEELSERDDDLPIINLYRPLEAEEQAIRCKLYSARGISLSDVLPTFEHMGAKVVDERPYEVTPVEAEPAWIYDFGLRCATEDLEQVREIFQDAFLSVWKGELEDDGLNALVLAVALTGRQIMVIRAIARYLRQGGISHSDAYMERTLLAHPDITAQLIALFFARFDPDGPDIGKTERLTTQIGEAIEAVESLDQDRILRSFLAVVQAVLRTNYFMTDDDGRSRPYLSFKVDPQQVPILPLPRPQFEIFVYSPRFEGVHLRGGRVARGGLRWSDRLEDFRTEILGLMKAQMVKNALIVPVGSKGGFVLKRPPTEREPLQDEAIACYRMFLAGLLDLTDNIVNNQTIAPDRVIRYDDPDPYLVVAADKGTASFSDIANEVSEQYGFWLGDAFASGGSHGYDHKAMGITARGGWESVKRHFRELGTDIQSTDFSVVGIGDMSGDVFGNGMLLSAHIRLIGAFNHAHVFVDPDPDPETSYEERKRLFDKSRSAWSDYDESKLSEGGGIYPRNAKSITISSQAKEALGIDADELSPTDLIKALLKAPVDLLWNGGIGTYVKSESESHADAGDKTNDSVRVNGTDLHCRVVGEGGNLGFTQRGRIDYALRGGPDGKGGRINTDAIDNVAGVNCSDHEVNIKILLDSLVDDGDLTMKQRNRLLVEMTDAVARQVLDGSYTQTQAMSLALAQAPPMIDVHARLIRHLEQAAALNREIEYLPGDDLIAERKAAHEGLVAPELAVVLAYCKIHLYSQLLHSDLPEDPFLGHDLERYFPEPLPERYREQMQKHRLRREIIATVVANQLVDRMGSTFAFRLQDETGASPSLLARAYAVAREVFAIRPFWAEVEELDNQVDANVQLDMLIEARRLVERSTRWLVRANPHGIDIEETIGCFEDGAKMLADALPEILNGADRKGFETRSEELVNAGVSAELACRVAGMPAMVSLFDIVGAARETDRDPAVVTAVYFRLGARLDLNWLRDRITELPRANRWQSLARAALRDELYGVHRALTQEVLEADEDGSDADAAVEAWATRHADALERCLATLADIRASRIYDTTTLPVGLREVRNLIRGRAATASAETRARL